MKILRLSAENFMRLSIVQITPEGHLIQIAGKNRQGKSSTLRVIWAALGGKEAEPDHPIRQGEESATIEVRLGANGETKYIVEKRFTPTNSYLTIKNAEGFKAQKPQQLLDGLLGALTFDPLDFMRSDAKKQFETLRGIVDLGVDLEEIDQQKKDVFEARTETNRKIKTLKAQIEAIVVPDDCPAEAIDTAAILDRLARVDEHNTEVRHWNQEVRDREQAIEAQRRRVEAAKKALAVEESGLKAAQELYDEIKDRKIDDLVDPQKIRDELAAAEAFNKTFRTKQGRDALMAQYDAAEEEANEQTLHLDAIEAEKRQALEQAVMPVPGLSFGDGAVTFNGLPLDQASDAEQLMVSTAIAAALNPTLRVIRIRDGSLLDEDSMKWLAEFAEKNDLQVWIETVGEGGPGAIVMEDGHVRGQEPPAEEKAE